ncbi:carbohydrate ABC transporter permease [Paenibacillus sp. CCS19]|uniref:carbohydrate ABC transporter permease n=1 Tax=Paenibacillus sp. CCS19 TaxID=3158387 RepID=UPI00295E685A|nr:carbohydrate ABC transporter permease [Paenibacillus cellulosilyticus]
MSKTSLVKANNFDRTITYALLILLSLVFILPFVWLVSTSLKPESDAVAFPPALFPNEVKWDNYAKVFELVPFGRFYLNTIIITSCSVIGTILSSSIVAYGFARISAKGKNFWFVMLLATMMLPSQVTMIPVYLIFSRLHWINTFLPLIVPAFMGSAFFIFLLRQFFKTIPRELEDAAIIDGCSTFGIFAKIILPLSGPAITTVAILSFMWSWNDFMSPLIYLNDQVKFTLAIGLQLFNGVQNSLWGPGMAASSMVIAPLVVLFFLAQRFFIEGIALSGIKG